MLDFLTENWLVISPIILEIVIRLIPTKKNLSLIDGVFKLLNILIPNYRKNSEGKTVLKDKTVYRIIIFFILLSNYESFAQSNVTGKAYYSTNVTDTTFAQTTRTNLETAYGNTGGFYFDKTRDKWRIWNGTSWVDMVLTPTLYGSTLQIPVTNTTGTNFLYSSALTYSIPSNIFRAGSSFTYAGTGTLDNNVLLGQSHQINGGTGNIRWSTLIGEQGIITNLGIAGKRIHNCSVIGGFGNTIRNDAAGQELFSCMIFNGNTNVIEATTFQTTSSTIIGGRNNYIGNSGVAYAGRYRGRATNHGAIALGYANTYNGTTGHTGTVQEVLASGLASVNISSNSTASVSGEGVLSDYSVILGGYDHNIPSTSPQSAIFGGSGIKARASDPNQIYFPNININTTPLNDDALTQILARDATTGQIKYRASTSLGGISGLTATRIPYAATATTLADNAGLVWDNTNAAVLVGATANITLNGAPAGVLLNKGGAISQLGNFTYLAGGSGANILLGKSRSSTVGTNTVVQNGDILGRIYFYGADGTNMVAGAWIDAKVAGTPGATDMPTELSFNVSFDGTGTPTNVMTIDPALKVGILDTDPNSRLTVNGSVANTVTTYTSLQTLGDSEYTVLGDATTAGFTLNLPAAATCNGRSYIIKKIDASVNAVTLDPSGAETIDGSATVALSTQYEFKKIQSNGTAWYIVGQ